jgi:RNA polymerase sigma-70 factor (ECF subfamily)
VIGILKHKLVDQVRRGTREVQFAAGDDEAGRDDTYDEPAFSSIEGSVDWGNPLDSLGRRQLLAQLDRCLAHLPPQQAQAFILRYAIGEETEEICHRLKITSGNLCVMLHRARNKLGSALQSWAPPAACAAATPS